MPFWHTGWITQTHELTVNIFLTELLLRLLTRSTYKPGKRNRKDQGLFDRVR
jgi:hypothetical protein